jgi:predicted nucleic acid-binding protein
MRKFLDTNIFLRYLTKDNEEKAYKGFRIIKENRKRRRKSDHKPISNI